MLSKLELVPEEVKLQILAYKTAFDHVCTEYCKHLSRKRIDKKIGKVLYTIQKNILASAQLLIDKYEDGYFLSSMFWDNHIIFTNEAKDGVIIMDNWDGYFNHIEQSYQISGRHSPALDPVFAMFDIRNEMDALLKKHTIDRELYDSIFDSDIRERISKVLDMSDFKICINAKEAVEEFIKLFSHKLYAFTISTIDKGDDQAAFETDMKHLLGIPTRAATGDEVEEDQDNLEVSDP